MSQARCELVKTCLGIPENLHTVTDEFHESYDKSFLTLHPRVSCGLLEETARIGSIIPIGNLSTTRAPELARFVVPLQLASTTYI